MQMLSAGGLPALTDQLRAADEDNPRGYYEFEAVKAVAKDKSWLDRAQGRAVKMVHLLLTSLPPDREYRVLFMRRDLREVLASQQKMLRRLGRPESPLGEEQLRQVFEGQLATVAQWLAARPDHFRVLDVDYNRLIANPADAAAAVNRFLDGGLHEAAMAAAVDPGLYRNRR